MSTSIDLWGWFSSAWEFLEELGHTPVAESPHFTFILSKMLEASKQADEQKVLPHETPAFVEAMSRFNETNGLWTFPRELAEDLASLERQIKMILTKIERKQGNTWQLQKELVQLMNQHGELDAKYRAEAVKEQQDNLGLTPKKEEETPDFVDHLPRVPQHS